MDLSLKKGETLVQQDMPQDLSLKRTRTSGTSNHHSSSGTSNHHSSNHLSSIHHPSSQQSSSQHSPSQHSPSQHSPSQHSSRHHSSHQQSPFPLHADNSPVTFPHVSQKTSSVAEHPAGLIPGLVDPKDRLVPAVEKSRLIPDLEQYIRAVMNLQPMVTEHHSKFTDQRLKALAEQSILTDQHRKAAVQQKTGSSRKTDVQSSSLAVPKRSALVVPDVRNRTQPEGKTKPRNMPLPSMSEKKARELPLPSMSEKLKSFSLIAAHEAQRKQLHNYKHANSSVHSLTEELDCRHTKPNSHTLTALEHRPGKPGGQTLTEQLLSQDLHSVDKRGIRSLEPTQHRGGGDAAPVATDSHVFLLSSLKHGDPSLLSSLKHGDPSLLSSLKHGDPSLLSSLKHDDPSLLSSLKHGDPSLLSSLKHGDPSLLSSLKHGDPSLMSSLKHGDPSLLSSLNHGDPSLLSSLKHGDPSLLFSLRHCDPSLLSSLRHCDPSLLSSLKYCDPSLLSSLNHGDPVLLSLPPMKENRGVSMKRRRKQECPRKRIRLHPCPPEEQQAGDDNNKPLTDEHPLFHVSGEKVEDLLKEDSVLSTIEAEVRELVEEDESPLNESESQAKDLVEEEPVLDTGEAKVREPVFTISAEMLAKVTDAAQNGELHRGLDELFAQPAALPSAMVSDNAYTTAVSAQLGDNAHITGGLNGLSNGVQVDNGEHSVKAQPKSCDNGMEHEHFPSPSLSPSIDGLPPFHPPGASPHKVKVKGPTTLANREERKALRLYGKEYTTPSGKTYPQRQVRPKDCSRCRYNCSSGICGEQRQALFDHFWSLDSYVKRLYYYCQSIKEKPAKTMKHTRECSREYTFLVNGERVRVCKGFYLATLDVSDKAVRIAMEKRKRGKGLANKGANSLPVIKTRPEEKDRVRSHIESVLIMDIYSKTGEGLPSTIPGQDLDLKEMHQDYVSSCQEEGKEPVTEDDYRNTFHTEYNLSTVQV